MLQGNMARKCCKEIWQDNFLRKYGKKMLQGNMARKCCKEIWQENVVRKSGKTIF